MEFEINITLQAQNVAYRNKNVSMNNFTEMVDQQYIVAAQILRNVCIPIIFCIGLFGNTLSLIVFCMRRMRKSPSSLFLAALALVDNIFLLGEMITWLDGEWINILSREFTCQCVIFVTYVSSFLSAWFIVGFSCERFFAICFPFKTNMCSVSKQKVAVLELTLLACAIYHFSFWTVTVQESGPRQKCAVRYEYIGVLQTVTWIDTALTFIFPFSLIATMNTMVMRKALASFGDPIRKKNTIVSSNRVCERQRGVRRLKVTLNVKIASPRFRLTRTLLLVSTIFLVLNLPSHIMRLYNLTISTMSVELNYTTSVKLYFFQEVALMLYYTTFSCNFAIYTLFVRSFRCSLKATFSCCSSGDVRRRHALRKGAINTSRDTRYSTGSNIGCAKQETSSANSVFLGQTEHEQLMPPQHIHGSRTSGVRS